MLKDAGAPPLACVDAVLASLVGKKTEAVLGF